MGCIKAKDSSNQMPMDGLLKSSKGGGWSLKEPLYPHLPKNLEFSAPSEQSKNAKMASIGFLYLLLGKFVWNVVRSNFQQ